MDTIMSYLKDPMKVGVFNCRISFNLADIEKVYEYLVENLESKTEKARIKRELRKFKRKENVTIKEVVNNLSQLIWPLIRLKKCPEVIPSYLLSRTALVKTTSEIHTSDFLSLTVLWNHNDGLHFEIIEPHIGLMETSIF